MRPDSPEEIFAVFIFAERMRNALTTPYQLMAIPHERTEETNDEEKKQASLCKNGQVFLLCGGLCFYESIRTAAVDGKSLKEIALLISILTTLKRLYGFVGI